MAIGIRARYLVQRGFGNSKARILALVLRLRHGQPRTITIPRLLFFRRASYLDGNRHQSTLFGSARLWCPHSRVYHRAMTILEFLATLAAGLFSGASIYINPVEHPARVRCGTALAVHSEHGQDVRPG